MFLAQEITSGLDDGLQQLNVACELGQKVKLRCPAESKAKVEQELSDMKRDWEKMNADISACNAKLDAQLVKWAAYDELRSVFIQWLITVETEIKMGVQPKTELAEKKAQLEKFRVLLDDVNKHEGDMSQLHQAVSELDGESSEVNEQLRDADDRHDAAKKQLQDIVDNLESAHAEESGYRDMLQVRAPVSTVVFPEHLLSQA